jgi:hypothetical protein
MHLDRPHDEAGAVLGIDMACPMPPDWVFANTELAPDSLLSGTAGKQ